MIHDGIHMQEITMGSVLMLGQSNMAGRGRIDEAVAIQTAGISVLRNGRWRAMYRPVNPDRKTSGVCLAESFAERYIQEHPGVQVGLIPCADGGSTINQWLPGTRLYDNAVFQAKLALRSSTIAGILWHQGESDSQNDKYLVHGKKLKLVLDSMRKELDLCDVPVLIGGLGDFLADYDEGHQQWPQINEEMEKLTQSDPKMAFVPATGLGHNGDNLHFNAEALYAFGLRYYEGFRPLEDPNKVFVEKEDPDKAIRSALEDL